MKLPGWLGRAVRAGVLLLVLAAALVALRAQAAPAWQALRQVGAAAALTGVAAALVGLLASALVWRTLLAQLGTRLALRPALYVFFVGQLGKYVPGSVFAVAAQMELGRAHGAPRHRVGTAGLLFMGVLVAAGLLVAAVTLPLTSPATLHRYGWVLAGLPLGLVALAPPVLSRLVDGILRLTRREPLERPLSWAGVGAALGWALLMWVSYGVHLVALLQALPHHHGPNRLLLATGAYALAWTVGFLVVLAPAGAGVREVALVLALSPVLSRGAALAVAVLSRVVMTVADLLWAGCAWLLRNGTPQKAAK